MVAWGLEYRLPDSSLVFLLWQHTGHLLLPLPGLPSESSGLCRWRCWRAQLTALFQSESNRGLDFGKLSSPLLETVPVALWGKMGMLSCLPLYVGHSSTCLKVVWRLNEILQGEPQNKVRSTEETLRGERCYFHPLGCDTCLCQVLVCFLLQTSRPGQVPPEWEQMSCLCPGQEMQTDASMSSMGCFTGLCPWQDTLCWGLQRVDVLAPFQGLLWGGCLLASSWGKDVGLQGVPVLHTSESRQKSTDHGFAPPEILWEFLLNLLVLRRHQKFSGRKKDFQI